MQFNLGYLQSNAQFFIKNFAENSSDEGRVLGIEELKNTEIQGLIVENDLLENDEIKHLLNEDHRFYPIRSGKDFSINIDDFKGLDFSSSKTVFTKLRDNWVLQNNVSLLEELFKVIDHLNALWPNDRTAFFEELWFILKSNLGAKEMTIIFNDMRISQKEHEKNKLVRAKIEGHKIPNPLPGGEFEDKVMAHYEKDFNQAFELMDYNKEKGELVITACIKKSPVVIMAKIYDISRLQKALMKSLFDGLSHES